MEKFSRNLKIYASLRSKSRKFRFLESKWSKLKFIGTDKKMSSTKRIIYFEPTSQASFSLSYIQSFAKFWLDEKPGDSLRILITPEFFEKNRAVLNQINQQQASNLEVYPIQKGDANHWIPALPTDSPWQKIRRQWHRWRLLNEQVQKFWATHVVLASIQSIFIPLILRARLHSPTKISGIYLHPTISHRKSINSQIVDKTLTKSQRIRRYAKSQLFYLAMKHPSAEIV